MAQPENNKFDTWGDPIQQKGNAVFRLVLRNVNSLPQDSNHNKNDMLINEILLLEADVYCANEINIGWQHIEQKHKVRERFKGKLEYAKFITSNNKDSNYTGSFQPGGTMMIVNGNVCGRVYESGTEENILQRWSWIKLRGKQNRNVVIVTVYRPVSSQGPTSAYQQHKSILISKDIDDCPRKQILSSLKNQIEQWKNENCEIIVAGDFNEDISGKNIRQYFAEMQMREITTEKHLENPIPNTTIQGSKPIDGIFGTDGIIPSNSGYLSFDWGMASDHRTLWVDIPLIGMLDTDKVNLWKPLVRRLKCSDPTIVKEYNRIRMEHILKHNGFKTLQKLNDNTIMSEEWQLQMEQLDQMRTESMQFAERHCRKLKMGAVPWSPEIQLRMARISYLQRCRLKYINGQEINSRTLQKCFQKTDFTDTFTDPTTIINQLKKEFKKYKEIKSKAETMRIQFLETLAQAKAEELNQKAEKVYTQLILHESIRTMFRKIKYALQSGRQGVTSVQARNTDGEWLTLTEKEDIEQACMQENIERFTQAKTSPPMLEDQIQILGWKADTETANKILQGQTTELEGVHPDLIAMAPYLQIPEAIRKQDKIREDITEEEYCRRWKRSREKTSSGTSGLHFGHFQASCKHKDLRELDRKMMEISLQTGYSLGRWKSGIDVMIPKKAGSNRVDKLRTIVLMEPDFNYINKIIGKRVMENAEKANSIANEQFGSRKAKSSILHAVNKQLTTDILRQDKKDFCLIILDAKACYDRITPMYAAFAMKRQGATSNMINLMFDTINSMKHYIRTSYGDSENCYQQQNQLFHGILQGNGAGPTMWAMISSTLLDKLRAQGMGISITTQTGEVINIPAFAFVDDTDLLQELKGKDDTKSPQEIVTEWNGGVQTTGGLLVGDKCSFQLIRHIWKNNQWIIDEQQNEKVTIKIPDQNGQWHQIKQNKPHYGEMALGIAFSPSGHMQEEVQYLKEKTTKWAKSIMRANINHYEAWIALRTTIFKTVEYALAATTMTKKEINNIISPALAIGLPKAGICRKISRKIIFTPTKFQGFGLKDPFITQGIRKLALIFNPSNVLTSLLINETWHRAMVECGVGPHMLQMHYDTYKGIVTKSWITSFWEFLTDSKIQLQKVSYKTRFRSPSDTYINTRVFEIKEWSNQEKIFFNMCRLHLNVELVSDIMTADGKKIRRHILEGYHTQISERFVKHNIDIPRPDRKAWKIWNKMLKRTFNIDDQGKFSQPQHPVVRVDEWQWFLDPITERIIRKLQTGSETYRVYRSSSRRRAKEYYKATGDKELSRDLIPVTVHQKGSHIMIDGKSRHYQTQELIRYIEWGETIQTEIIGSQTVMESYMEKEQLILLSDASVKEGIGYAAWIVTTANAYGSGTYIKGIGKIFEPNTDSHRSECFGILGAIYSTQTIMSKWNAKSPKPWLVVCDNKSALEYACNRDRYKNITSSHPDFDVLMAIRYQLKSQEIDYKHVKGHQDTSTKPHDILTTLNIQVDALADEAADQWEARISTYDNYNYLKGEEWQISIGGEKIYKEVESNIREWVARQQIPGVWDKYKRINETWFEEVNWTAMETAMNKSPITTRHWIIKRCARDCGANAIRYRRKEIDNDKCPFCGIAETVEHVYLCQHETVKEVWEMNMKEFEEELWKLGTDPNIIQQLMKGLRGWRQGNIPNLLPMVQDQSQIGWNGILEGVVGLHWCSEQEIYSTQETQATNSRKWAHLVIRKLWKIAWSLWENRNQEEHKNDQAKELQRLLEQVEKEVDIGTQGHSRLKTWFKATEIEKVKKGSSVYIQCWLRAIQVRRARIERLTNQSETYARMRETMRRFLGSK